MTTEVQSVWVVVKQSGAGYVVLVASTMTKAAKYIDDNPYSSFTLYERTLDKPEG